MGSDLERQIARLRQGDHLCLLYQSTADQLAVLVPFFKHGLSGGERCLFIGDATVGRRLEQALAERGVDCGRERERGALVLLTQRDADSGRDPGLAIDLLRQAEQQALDDGLNGLRVAADRCWAMADEAADGSPQLVRYEAMLEEFIHGSRTLALCQCRQHSFAPSVVLDLLRTHPIVLLDDRVCTNAFYEPPQMVFGMSSAEDRVDRMLACLRQVRAGEEERPQNGQTDATRRILVVEDNPDAAATMRDLLELAGHEVELAMNGSDGVAAARQFHPEVVLCDLGLPGMDGYEVAAELRRDPTTASARLIAVTGYGRDEDRRRSKEAGFDIHLTKPVDPRQLRRLIRESGPLVPHH